VDDGQRMTKKTDQSEAGSNRRSACVMRRDCRERRCSACANPGRAVARVVDGLLSVPGKPGLFVGAGKGGVVDRPRPRQSLPLARNNAPDFQENFCQIFFVLINLRRRGYMFCRFTRRCRRRLRFRGFVPRPPPEAQFSGAMRKTIGQVGLHGRRSGIPSPLR